MKKIVVLTAFICIYSVCVRAQCSSTISTFPYTENFELTNGGWNAGGTGSSWAWGTPAKPVINSAGSGLKCWVNGGLTGTSYTNCDRSYVESPCFDFTLLQHPAIAFKLFWECEYQFDGLTFQYSINNGTTWVNVGAFNDPINCYTDNWFNYGNITHLSNSGGCTGTIASVKHGWCGNSQSTSGSCQGGNGSNTWILAKHCIDNLAGQSSVQFRFGFGAGSSCNAFEGVAFDSVAIWDAPPIAPLAISYTCNGANSLQFSATTASTNCVDTYSWNFGQPSSGANNTSTIINPTHNYGNGGTYTVTLTNSRACASNTSTSLTVQVPTLSLVKTNVTCNGGNNGAALLGFGSSSTFTLLPGSITSSSGNYTGLLAGAYTVSASNASGCAGSTVFVISEPNAITAVIAPSSTNTICTNGTGSIVCNAGGGTGSLSYTISPGASSNTTGVFNSLNAGTYTITITDANNCTKTATHTIAGGANIFINSILSTSPKCFGDKTATLNIAALGSIGLTYNLQLGNITNTTGAYNSLGSGTYTVTVADVNGCTISSTITITEPSKINYNLVTVSNIKCYNDNNGSITASASGGSGTLFYTILPNNITQLSPSFNNLTAGTYTIIAKDANGCTNETVATVNASSSEMQVTLLVTDIGCVGKNNDGAITTQIVGGTGPFTYDWNTTPPLTTANITDLFPGYYGVKVYDANGCFAAQSTQVKPAKCCESIYIPNAFSPNADGINDKFGISTYIDFAQLEFVIYNRWGEVLWSSTNPNVKWDGTYKNATCEAGTYFYYFRYTCKQDGNIYIKKGDLLLVN
jgi:gliding motility-associated-like protein